jgi:rod shape determining protein RodA
MRQFIHFLLFLPLMIIAAAVDIKFWFRISYLIYLLNILLLIGVVIYGYTAMGATRWLNLGVLKLQPSELMKLSIVMALARYFHDVRQCSLDRMVTLLPALLMIILPFILIALQPDLTTAAILFMVGAMLFFLTGVNIKIFLVSGIAALASLPLIWHQLHDYQKQRIVTFLNPESDRLGSGYNIIQSKIAIGSGGLWGKGLLQGSQSQLSFLPEHQTDFVFTMLSEELGFVRALVILLLYSALICYGIFVATNSRNHYGRLVASGITTIFFLHIFINIAMVMGLVPVAGTPLPLISYGGTMMMTIMVGFGLICNVHIHHNNHIGQDLMKLV